METSNFLFLLEGQGGKTHNHENSSVEEVDRDDHEGDWEKNRFTGTIPLLQLHGHWNQGIYHHLCKKNHGHGNKITVLFGFKDYLSNRKNSHVALGLELM